MGIKDADPPPPPAARGQPGGREQGIGKMEGRHRDKSQPQPLQAQQSSQSALFRSQQDEHVADIGGGDTGKNDTGGARDLIPDITRQVI